MLKRRSKWLAGSGALLLTLSLSGMVTGAEPVVTDPVVAVDTSATYEDIDGNGIDDDCQDVAAVEDLEAAAAELLTVDLDANGVISTSEAAHSPRTGGKNCNHGGYVSWIAHQNHNCAVEPPVVEPTVVLIVTTPPDAEPEVDEAACDPVTGDAAITAAHKDKVAAAAARAASKAERTLAREARKAERAAAKAASKAERNAAKDAKKAAHAAAKAAKAKHKSH